MSFAIIYLILWRSGELPDPLLPPEMRWWYFPATILGPWIVTALGASIGLSGRAGAFFKVLCTLFVSYIGLGLFSKYALTIQAQHQLGRLLAYLFCLVCVGATFWLFVKARRNALINRSTLVISALAIAALLGGVAIGRVLHPAEPSYVYLLLTGCVFLTIVPFAAAPLALAANRHR